MKSPMLWILSKFTDSDCDFTLCFDSDMNDFSKIDFSCQGIDFAYSTSIAKPEKSKEWKELSNE